MLLLQVLQTNVACTVRSSNRWCCSVGWHSRRWRQFLTKIKRAGNSRSRPQFLARYAGSVRSTRLISEFVIDVTVVLLLCLPACSRLNKLALTSLRLPQHLFIVFFYSLVIVHFLLQLIVLLPDRLVLLFMVNYLLYQHLTVVLLAHILNFELLIPLHQLLVIFVDFLGHRAHCLQGFPVRSILLRRIKLIFLPLCICLFKTLLIQFQILI